MIRRFYVHNYRCLENFELNLSQQSSWLLMGKNGSGKSTVGWAFEILQQIGRGVNRIGDLFNPNDFAQGRQEIPMRFELEVEVMGRCYRYHLALELPAGFRELRISEETLWVDDLNLFKRSQAQVDLNRGERGGSRFLVDWHLIALPLIQEESDSDPLFVFKRWMSRILILAPVPSLIRGDSEGDTLLPDRQVRNFGSWFSGLIAHSPSAYAQMERYLKEVFPDLVDIKNPLVGKNQRSLEIGFRQDQASCTLPFDALSDGEKCFFICALVLAASKAYGPVFCFWDEADAHLSMSEVGQFVMALRASFAHGGQLLLTSHHPQGILHFTSDSTLVLQRRSHLEPTQVRLLNQFSWKGDLIETLQLENLCLERQ